MMKRLLTLIITLIMISCTLVACDYDMELFENVTEENVWTNIDEIIENYIAYSEATLVKGEIPSGSIDNSYDTPNIMYELPDINEYPLIVDGENELDVEVVVPVEDNGSGIIDFLKFVGTAFNAAKKEIEGKTVSVSIRALEPSLAEDYILSGSTTPQGYMPPNDLCAWTLRAKGAKLTNVTEKTVFNTVGVAIPEGKMKELYVLYGNLTPELVVKATLEGNLKIGYPNPTVSPTGLNFVYSTLAYFDASNPTSFEATTDFTKFQSTVPYVSFSSEQMYELASKHIIDAYVIEGQAFYNNPELNDEVSYIPFGTEQNYPLYEVGILTPKVQATLLSFAEFVGGREMQEYAINLGFNNEDMEYEFHKVVSDTSLAKEILDAWKEVRNATENVSIAFVADISGSMSGEKIEALKESLLSGMQYVGEDTRVGLFSYNSVVYLNVPFDEFDTEQQEYFAGAVENLYANGGTATNNAILVASDFLHDEPPENRKLIILLSDGHTGSGFSFEFVKQVIDATDIPIYTIGYGEDADVNELKEIAGTNHGMYTEASTDNISYLMKTIFNAEA